MDQPLQISLVGSHQGNVPDDVVVIKDELGYALVCRSLRDGEHPAIWTRARVHFEWLKAYTDLIGTEACFVEKTPKLLLADAWQVDVPHWLTDEAIEKQQLLQVDIPAGHPQDFARTALGALLGDVFFGDRLTEEALIQIVQALTTPSASDVMERYPVLSSCLADSCERWVKAMQEPWSEMVCSQIQSNPGHLHRDLTYLILLGGYPQKLLEFKVALQHAQALLSMDRSALRRMALHQLTVTDATEQINLFFADVSKSVSNESEFEKVLSCTSGLLSRELDLLHDILSSVNFSVTESIVRKVQDHFAAGRGVSKVKLALLNHLVVPPRPRIPGPGATWEWPEWLSWASEEYLPFRHWQQLSGTHDPELEGAVAQFSDWYLAAYESIHADATSSIAHVLTSLTEEIQRDEVSLVLIVDCLPQTFLAQLSEAFCAAGFHRHDSRSVCALLPTFTEVCKPILVTGEWAGNFKSYEKAVVIRAEQSWPTKTAQYFGGDLNALRASGPFENSSVLVLNYLPGDETLHSDAVAAGSTYEEELYRIYARLADTAKEVFARCGTPADKFGVYVVTDHGATKVLPEETENLESSAVQKLFPVEKHRFASIDDAEVDSIPANLWEFGYRFKQPFRKSSETYFIPRGHNTIRSGTPKGYVHGGATPEEVIVPVITWRPIAVPWKQPAVRFVELSFDTGTGKALFYVKRMSTLCLELQNPNTKSIAIGQTDLVGPEADVRGSSSGTVLPGKTLVVKVECSFGSAALNSDELAVRINYSIEGNQQVVDCRTEALFKSAMTGGFNLRDL
ncbi:hypothetical protein OAK97_00875 [bacterium]|nr:hypothetical protein [bacterium]